MKKKLILSSLIISSLLGMVNAQAISISSPVNAQKFTINSKAIPAGSDVTCLSCLEVNHKNDNVFYSYYLKPNANEQGEVSLAYIVRIAPPFRCLYQTKIPFTLDSSGNFNFNFGMSYGSTLTDHAPAGCEANGPVTIASKEADTILFLSN